MRQQETEKAWFTGQVVRCQADLFRVARSILKTDEDAEDAVQEAILSAYARLHLLRQRESFKPWLLRILVNQCYDVCRRTHATVELSGVEETLPAPEPDRTEALSLWQAVGQLSRDLRVTVVLFYYEDYSIRQISEVLGLSQDAVKARLHRARQRLKQLLREEGGTGNAGSFIG